MNDACMRDLMRVGLFHVNAKSDAEIEAALPPENAPNYEYIVRLWTFADQWAQSGFPRIVVGHRHAAALMATRTAPSAVAHIQAPWQAFAIDVPDGLVEPVLDDGTIFEVAHAFVVIPDGEMVMVHLGNRKETRVFMSVPALGQLGAFEGKSPMETFISRLVMGVCMEMTSHRPARAKGFGARPIKQKRGVPETWTFRLARDVKVDCREAVRDYVRGITPSSPTVQSLVRGHWKEQAHGPGGKDRKAIFVEPYWRGPEDAPIAVRSLKPGGGDEPEPSG